MTKNQIVKILTRLGYSTEMDIPLSEVSSIYLCTDGCLYPDENTRFNFHEIGDSGVLIVSKGTKKENGEFEKESVKTYIDFAVISGFTMVSEKHIAQPFKISKAV